MRLSLFVVVLVGLQPGFETWAAPQAAAVLTVGSVYECELTDSASFAFDGKAFTASSAKEQIRIQIRILRAELEMTLKSRGTGEIYVEKDSIVSRTLDGRSLFAIYKAPVGNVLSISLHVLTGGAIVFSQNKTYQLPSGQPNLYQSTTTGICRQLNR